MIWAFFLILAVYFLLDIIYRKTNRYQNRFEDTKKIREYKNTPLDLINIGSTQARYAYDYNNSKGLNIATNEQSLEYSFLLLKKYSKYLNKGGNVIISLSDMDMLLRADLQQRKYKYFGILPVPKADLIKNILFPLIFMPKDIKYIFKDEKAYNKFDVDTNILHSDSDKSEDCNRRILRWKSYGVKSFDPFKGFEINNNNINYNIELIKNIVGFCKAKGYNVYIVTPPASPYFYSFFGDKFKDVLNKPLEKIAITENVKYIDFTSNNVLDSENLFLNTACMNSTGRKEFTDIIQHKVLSEEF